jgi:hypothetical protein
VLRVIAGVGVEPVRVVTLGLETPGEPLIEHVIPVSEPLMLQLRVEAVPLLTRVALKELIVGSVAVLTVVLVVWVTIPGVLS